MKRFIGHGLLILTLAVVLGCASTPESRRKELVAQYPTWPQDTILKVSRGLVEMGMTKEQAREALKTPQRYDVHMDDDRWNYVDDIIYDREAKQEYGKILIFKDDRIVRIRNFLRIPDLLITIEWD